MAKYQKGKTSIKNALANLKKHAIDIDAWQGDNVIMSKALVSGIHNVELNGKRVLALAMSHVEQKKATLNNQSWSVEINADDYSRIFGIEKKETYKAMKRGLDEVLHASVALYSIHKETLSLKTEKMSWVKHISYIDGCGKMTLLFNDLLTPHITRFVGEKNGGYTLYKLEQAGKLKSIYSWRLFELFSQFRDTGWYSTDVQGLIEQLEVPPNIAANFAKFKKYCLDPAMLELREKSRLDVTYQAEKTGRKYTKIKFTFKDEKPTEVNDKAQEEQSIWKADRLEEDSSQEPQTTESSDIYDYDFFGNGEPKEPTRLT